MFGIKIKTDAVPSYWMSWLLVAAGLYNITWAIVFVLYPLRPFQLAGITPLSNPLLLRTMGIAIGGLGAGFLIAALAPIRYWPIVLVGLLAKVIGPLKFTYLALQNPKLWSLAWVIVINDVIWWAPFGFILASAYRHMRATWTTI
jgi:hypothetical protein